MNDEEQKRADQAKSPEPECTCNFRKPHAPKFDPACYYHGDNGTMVSTINVKYGRIVPYENSATVAAPVQDQPADVCRECGGQIGCLDCLRAATVLDEVDGLRQQVAELQSALDEVQRLPMPPEMYEQVDAIVDAVRAKFHAPVPESVVTDG